MLFKFSSSLEIKGRNYFSEMEKEGKMWIVRFSSSMNKRPTIKFIWRKGSQKRINFGMVRWLLTLIADRVRHSQFNYKAQDSHCVGLKRNKFQLLSQVWTRRSALVMAAASPNADGTASVKPALTLWQLSVMQSGNTIWDIALHIIPWKLFYTNILWIFHFSLRIHSQGVE